MTNLAGRPDAIYRRIYAPRGDTENRVKEAKDALHLPAHAPSQLAWARVACLLQANAP